MEDILEVYTREYDENHVLVCMDECPKQLIGETRIPVAGKPGRIGKYDNEYRRNGTAELFMFTAPLKGWRRVAVTERRTKQDWAMQVKHLVDNDFPNVEKIIFVLDNLNIHKIGSLYETFPPEEAGRIKSKLEIHYTPKHGSWLNMAEIEINILVNHGLSKRIPDMKTMKKQASAWYKNRNKTADKIDWRFTTAEARIKLKRLYPQFL
jgi:hypothetical protein